MRLGLVFIASCLCAVMGVQGAIAQSDTGTPVAPPDLIEPETAPTDAPLELPGAANDSGQASEVEAPIVTAPVEAEGVSTTRYQDWALECSSDPEMCQISHRVLADGEQQVVVVIAMHALEDGGPASIQIAVPLGISARAGMRLAIGAEYQANIAIERCTPQGCISEGTASDALLSAMRRGQRGQISVLNEAGTNIDLPFSLMGFTASYGEMIARNALSDD